MDSGIARGGAATGGDSVGYRLRNPGEEDQEAGGAPVAEVSPRKVIITVAGSDSPVGQWDCQECGGRVYAYDPGRTYYQGDEQRAYAERWVVLAHGGQKALTSWHQSWGATTLHHFHGAPAREACTVDVYGESLVYVSPTGEVWYEPINPYNPDRPTSILWRVNQRTIDRLFDRVTTPGLSQPERWEIVGNWLVLSNGAGGKTYARQLQTSGVWAVTDAEREIRRDEVVQTLREIASAKAFQTYDPRILPNPAIAP